MTELEQWQASNARQLAAALAGLRERLERFAQAAAPAPKAPPPTAPTPPRPQPSQAFEDCARRPELRGTHTLKSPRLLLPR